MLLRHAISLDMTKTSDAANTERHRTQLTALAGLGPSESYFERLDKIVRRVMTDAKRASRKRGMGSRAPAGFARDAEQNTRREDGEL